MLQVVLLLLLVVHATGQALPPTTADLASLAPAPTPLVCGAAGTLLGALPLASDFDYWVLRLFWPPALYATNVDGAAAAEAEAEAGSVGRGFWTHGLWNSETGGRPRAPPKPTPPGWERGSCANDALAAANFTPPLMAQLAGVQPGVPGNFSEATDLKFWSHEWNKHGSCSGLSVGEYFGLVAEASSRYLPLASAALAKAGIAPHSEPYTLGQVSSALSAAFGPSFNATTGVFCSVDDSNRTLLSEVQICLAKQQLEPCQCPSAAPAEGKLANYQPCGGPSNDPSALVYVVGFMDAALLPSVPYHWLWILGLVMGVTLLALVITWVALVKSGRAPHLLVPKKPVEVHNPLVHLPVEVVCEPVNMAGLTDRHPLLAAYVRDLPQGMGIKGGIARKVLKALHGTPEPPSKFDIDVVVMLARHPTAEEQRAVREAVSGLKIGDLELEPQDVEVSDKEHLREYFHTRDCTMNEVALIKTSGSPAPSCSGAVDFPAAGHGPSAEGGGRGPMGACGALPGRGASAAGDSGSCGGERIMLFYTRQSLEDVKAGLIRPSTHALRSKLATFWAVDPRTGQPHVTPVYLTRCLIRYLKGHGNDYAFDRHTWRFYRANKLNRISLFKVLKPFHDDSRKLQSACNHLVSIGFLSRLEIIRAGGTNKLWGLLLKEVNDTIAAFGGRLTLSPLDTDGVEAWLEDKQAEVTAKVSGRAVRARRTGYYESAEDVASLGLLRLPPELHAYIEHGATFPLPPAEPATEAAVVAVEEASLGLDHIKSPETAASAQRPPSASAGVGQKLIAGQAGEVWQGVDSEAGYEPLVPDKDAASRRQPPARQLLAFALSVARPQALRLLLAYVLLLLAVAGQLWLPWVQGAIFDAVVFNAGEAFRRGLITYVCIAAGTQVLQLCGSLLMDVVAKASMERMQTALFNHLLMQDPSFFVGMSPGELMNRIGGDSLALRGLLTTTAFMVVEGILLFLGSLGVIIALLTLPYDGPRTFQIILPVTIIASLVEAAAVGAVVRPLNLKMRQSMGRTFGFNLDIFTNIGTVASLGISNLLQSDYARFASDVAAGTCRLALMGSAHRCVTLAMASAMRLLFLWQGGYQVMMGFATVGELVAVLRYVSVEQKGLNQLATGWARCMSSIGSLERLLQLHNRGTLPVPRSTPEQPPADASGRPASGPRRRLGPLRCCGWLDAAPFSLGAGPSGRSEAAEAGGVGKAAVALEVAGPALAEDGGLRSMMGGVALRDAAILGRGKAKAAPLRHLDFEVLAGQALVLDVSKAAPGAAQALLEVLALQRPPTAGAVELQVPSSQQQSCTSEGRAPGGGAGRGWRWRALSPAGDDPRAAMHAATLVSPQACAPLRASATDNVACAAAAAALAAAGLGSPAAAPPTHARVRAACEAVGLHDDFLGLPEGYNTLVGSGTEFPLSEGQRLRLGLARILVWGPRLVVVTGAPRFEEALGGRAQLAALLSRLAGAGGSTVVVAVEGAGVAADYADSLGARVDALVGGSLQRGS